MITRLLMVWMLAVTPAAAQTGTPVEVRRLSDLLTPIVYTAPAEVVSANRARISARIEARIDAIPVNVGDTVEQGQEIVVLDCADHELARRRAEAELQSAAALLERARQQLARSETLAPRQLLSQDLLEQRATEKQAAEARVRRARADLDQAQLTVDRCRMRSPFDGAVTQRLAARGELARPGTPLLEIVDLGSVEVAAQVFPAEQHQLESSAQVVFRFLNEDHPVRLLRRSPVIDPVSRTLAARLAFTGPPAPVGASGRLVWHGSDPGVPASLLVRRDSGLGIFIARQGRAEFHPLPDAQEGRPAMVELPADTLVVTSGRQGLRDGDPLVTGD